MRRTMRSPSREPPTSRPSTRPSGSASKSHPPISMHNRTVSPNRPRSPYPYTSTSAYASTDLSPDAHAQDPAQDGGPRFTSAPAAVAAARVLTATHPLPLAPVHRKPAKSRSEGRHFASAKEKHAESAPKPASAQQQRKPAPAPLSDPARSAPPLKPIDGPIAPSPVRTPSTNRQLADPNRVRTFGIGGEGVTLGYAQTPRTPRVGEGVDLVPLSARLDSAPATPRGYEREETPNYLGGARFVSRQEEREMEDQRQREEERVRKLKESFVPMNEPGSWSANVTGPLPRVRARGSRPVLRLDEEGRRRAEEGERGKSLSRVREKVGGWVKKGPSRNGSTASAKSAKPPKTPSRPVTPSRSRPGTAQDEREKGPQRSGSLVEKALDFFAPDRHDLMAAGAGTGLKGRMRVKAGLPPTPSKKVEQEAKQKDSLESDTSEPRDEDVWRFSRTMGARLEQFEKENAAAKQRDAEYAARADRKKVEEERLRAMNMLTGGEDKGEHGARPGTSDSQVTTMTQFINARDSVDSDIPRPPPLVIRKQQTGPEPREIWKEIEKAQGKLTIPTGQPTQPLKILPVPKEEKTAKGKEKEAAGFGMNYLPPMEFGQKAIDCGIPDSMEECRKCGQVPAGAQVLKNGLCAKCTHPALRDAQQKAALQLGDRSSEVTIWPRQSQFNRFTTYSVFGGNPFVSNEKDNSKQATSLSVLPEADAIVSTSLSAVQTREAESPESSYGPNHQPYIPPRAQWRRASTMEDVRSLQNTRNTAFYGFYDQLLPTGKRESVAQNMTRRPSYF